MFDDEHSGFTTETARTRPTPPLRNIGLSRCRRACDITMTTAWQGRLDEASSIEDVLRVVTEFLSFWTAEERQVIPEVYRPGSPDNAQQVNSHAFRLAA